MMQVFFNTDGTSVTAIITVIVDGTHTDPDSWPIADDPAIVLSTHPAAAKTVTAIDTGVFKVVWTGLSPALTHGEIFFIAVDGLISTVAWSTWQMPFQCVLLPNTVAPATPANVTTSTSTITALLPSALVGGRIDASVGSNLDKTGYSLATTQPSITWQPQTITAGDGTPNITLAGSGNADGIAWTRSGSGDPLDADIVDQIQSGLATSAELPTDFDTLVITDGDIAGTVGGIAGTITTLDALDTAQDTQHGTTQDRLGYTLAALAGACADAGTATETYAITIGADTYTIDHTGLDATGNRSTATLTKS
jgi:hypothetical protein